MEKVITIAVAGYGLRGQCYSQYTLEHPDTMKVVAVADIVREKVDAAKQLFNLPEQMCFDSAEQMLEQPKLADLMFICTQDRQHVPMALAALEKGYHVLLEKPISPELSECIELQKKRTRKQGGYRLPCSALQPVLPDRQADYGQRQAGRNPQHLCP